MNRRAAFALAAFVLGSVGLADTTPEIQQTSAYLKGQSDQVLQQYMTGMMGPNPLEGLFGQASAISKSGLYKVWISVSLLIAIVGFALSITNIAFEDANAIKQLSRVTGRFLITGALIGSAYSTQPWSLHQVTTKTIAGSYTFGLTTFAGDFNAKLEQTRESFTDMLGATVVVGTTLALPQGAGALRAGTAALSKTFASGGGQVLAAKASAAAASTGIKAAGTKVVSFVMNRLGGLFTALQYFLSGYSALVTAAGWLTVLMLLALPVGLATVNFGETRVLWTAFGTWAGLMLSLSLMPAVLVNAMDTVLVQSVQSMKFYTAELGYQAQLQQKEAAKASKSTQSEMDKMLAQCQDARNVDPANIDSNPCQKVVNQGALVQFGGWLQGGVAQAIAGAIEGIVANIADSFVSFGVMIVRLMIGVVLAGMLMFGVPVAAITFFGGVAMRK
ncbi:hypothetical protein [Deinococcus humi]|uniref:Uncharacterized protein n=1 Tax=Deinococcus humi TaxID=662880 RepID=A0A7W8JZ58_9DEIO|nr:hypothetical protein [Deinococcus humi]MBB5365916.1 hypothetical protein [Deinococcus humi]GGO40455.1 hypothetical protein GCM10008949_49990 [Deinococcus humi]